MQFTGTSTDHPLTHVDVMGTSCDFVCQILNGTLAQSVRLWHDWYAESYDTYAEKLPIRHNSLNERRVFSHEIVTASLNLKSDITVPISVTCTMDVNICTSGMLIVIAITISKLS